MLVNGDFSRRAVVAGDRYRWVASPQAGVSRVMLDRVGGEVARATSVVRYGKGSSFPRHEHPGGEEILVLCGVFSDENGDYPAGWYLRNPPGSAHRPSSGPGATLLVKLRQMAASEDRSVRIDTRDPARWTQQGSRETCVLFESGAERVALERVPANAFVPATASGGVELFVVSGELVADEDVYPTGSWLRMPPGDTPALRAGAQGATVYAKAGHLDPKAPAA